MGLMTFLRNRAGLIVTVIGIAIVAFLLGDVVRTGAPFWASSQNQVGSVNGESISYPDFNVQVEQASAMFQQQMGGGSLTPQMKNYAVQQVWNQFVTKEILKQEVEKIGLSVGKDELNALVNGPNPSYQIVQAFTNPQTGQFDKAQLNMFLSRLKSDGTPEMQQQWEMLLEGVRDERMGTKYTNLLNNSIYVTSLEANDDYIQRNKLANFKYVLLDYSSIKDADIKLTDADYKEYYDENKNAFKNPEETRSIEYVLVDGRPNQRDTAATLAVVQKLKADLAASTNDSLFASVNSDTKYPYTYLKKGQVSPALDSVLFNAPVGATVGPFLSNGVYEIAKIKDATFSPDSVKASHILLNPTAEGGVDKAKAKADSIKNLIAKGEAFGPLAIQFSQDEGSKANGGDLGTFGRGRMVPEFDKAVFEGKTGDVLIVNSQFGVHIVKIEKQIGNSKVVKAAIVDKTISSGKETIDAAYAKANSFFSALDKDNFKAVATKQGLKDATAKRVTAMDNTLDGNEVPRELLRWAFEAKKGDVTDKVYETDHTFIVARLADIQPKGILPLEAIKADIETPVRNLVKARQLKEKAENALKGASSIDQVGQKLGKSPIQVENIVLANPVIPGVALENAVVGTVFGLQPNKPSTAIKGNQGVYVVQVNGFVNPKNQVATEIKAQQKQLIASKAQRSWNSIFKALQDKAKIDDNRIRFF
ncbi:SurA N-terminal domain-containing protein [Sphingobacterium spiritivorum]|uniref:Periplasmic chaperone PpiD n=1 Tax=Sphingobacterium spiritivorum ATCC 33861 TaxID=525373 RepID=D7VH72_SPHSI|nr:SurA N-terminal domain-containing protein [Sphingobacterium spiritivorum]EFK59424.1 PPIC-type PPIASE domain protein [Sphingobacterium spiritivorum ATCC 33861]QQT33895.1 SurA N-terminal domain-containing protein [Sphingobacterium spiritivorum]WQD34713.1 SurA N-terminal domain-containing protein [Sphingobacterium spiritivorum]